VAASGCHKIMTRTELEYLAGLQDDNHITPIYRDPRTWLDFRDVRGEGRRVLQRESDSLMQPDFVYNYALSFIGANKDLPEMVKLPQHKKEMIMCLADFLRGDFKPDDPIHKDIKAARLLMGAQFDVARNTINALLMIEGATYEQIGWYFNLRAQVIRFYGHIFWNVKERLRERDYLVTLAYPYKSRAFAILEPNYLYRAGGKNLHKQLALDHDVEMVALAGKVARMTPAQLDRYRQLFEGQQMFAAVLELNLGGGHGFYPGITQATKLVQADKMGGQESKMSEETIGLETISQRNPVVWTLERMVAPSVAGMIQANQEEAEARAKEQQRTGKTGKQDKDQEAPKMLHAKDPNWAHYDERQKLLPTKKK